MSMIDASPDSQGICEKLRSFVLEKYPSARKQGLSDETQLLQGGLLDSLGILDLVTFVEQEFSVQVSDEELAPENFQDLKHLAAFVQGKVLSLRESPASGGLPQVQGRTAGD